MDVNGDGGAAAIVVMGVAGCGKTTVGRAVADALGWPFLEGDELHPPANIAKMTAGFPLEDEDRWGWLDAIAERIVATRRAGGRLVVSCSALKRRYRERLCGPTGRVLFVHLHGDRATILARMAGRSGHFMPVGLLDSQFAALETPGSDELCLGCDVTAPPEEIARRVVAFLQRS